MNEIFSQIYGRNEWIYGSGEGSLPMHTRGYVAFLQSFLREKSIRSVVDMGCGDWQFSQLVDWRGTTYRGFDVVPAVIERNRARFAAEDLVFSLYSGDPADLPAADLLLVKDVLQHLPNHRILSFLPCLRRYRYALLTNCVNPRGVTENADIEPGGFRHLDLRRPPFNLAARQVFAFSKNTNPIRRLLRRAEWTKIVLFVDNSAGDTRNAG